MPSREEEWQRAFDEWDKETDAISATIQRLSAHIPEMQSDFGKTLMTLAMATLGAAMGLLGTGRVPRPAHAPAVLIGGLTLLVGVIVLGSVRYSWIAGVRSLPLVMYNRTAQLRDAIEKNPQLSPDEFVARLHRLYDDVGEGPAVAEQRLRVSQHIMVGLLTGGLSALLGFFLLNFLA